MKETCFVIAYEFKDGGYSYYNEQTGNWSSYMRKAFFYPDYQVAFEAASLIRLEEAFQIKKITLEVE